MKRKALAAALSLITALSLAGCGEKEEEVEISERPRVREETEATPTPEPTPEATPAPEPEPFETTDYDALYAPVINEIYDAIENGYDYDKEYKYLPMGLVECINYEDRDQLLDTVGYRIEDISGDGIPELLIGRNEQTDTNVPGEVSTVYSCYTAREDGPITAFEGMTRSTFRWIGDGHFYYFGSSGAAYSAFGECHLTTDGAQNEWDDFYFTDENDDLSISFYHNKSGVWSPDYSEKLEISDVDFWNLLSDVKYEKLDWTPIAFAVTDGNTSSDVSVEWADDVVDETTDYLSYEPDHTDQYTRHVLISVDTEVKDFKLYEVSLADVDDDGNAVFDKTEVYITGSITPDKPLCAGMNFPGDTPHNAFEYKDDNGEIHFFVIDISGRDGSLVVTEQK